MARRGGACLLLAVGLAPRAARAEAAAAAGASEAARVATERAAAAPAVRHESSPLAVRVTYHAPPACPSGSDFLGTLARHLAVGGEGAVDADVSIAEDAGGGFELRLRQRVAGRESVSVTRAESCDALMQLAALNASMARLPDALAGSLPAESPRSPALAAPPPPAPEPAAALGAGEAPSPAPALGVDVGEPGSAARRAPRPPVHGFVLGELRAASGMLPRPAWGRGAALGAAAGPWSLRASLTWWQAQDASFSIDGGSPIAMKFTQQSLELAPCLGHALSPLLALHGCALLAGHRTASTAEPAQLSASVGAGALAALSPWRGLRIEVQGGVQAVLGAPEFDADALRSIYRADTLQPTARIAIGWEFGARPPPPEPDATGAALAAPRGRDGGGV